MGYVTSWGFIVDFVILDAGILIGWCLRVGITRAQAETRAIEHHRKFAPHDNFTGVPFDGTGSIARWP